MIIKEADVVITHFGVQGMRWGVRKDRYEQNRQKASNIVSKNKDSKGMNKQDLTAAEWMSKPVSDKIASEIFKNTINVAAGYVLTGTVSKLKDPKTIAKTAAHILKRTAMSTALKEVSSAAAISKRYKTTGEKDYSVKQYKRHSLTPEQLIMRGTRVAISMAPVFKAVGRHKLEAMAKRKYETNIRMEKWGANLLDKKTSELHTIYDDGYLSVLEKISSKRG